MRSFTREIGPEIPGSLFASSPLARLWSIAKVEVTISSDKTSSSQIHSCVATRTYFETSQCIHLGYILYGFQSHTLMSANKGWLTASGQCWGKMDWEWVHFGIRGSHRFSQKWTCLVLADLPPLGLSRINQLWAVEGWHHQVMRISGIMNGSSSWSFFYICSLCCLSSSIPTLVWDGFKRKMWLRCPKYTWP